MNEYPDFPDQKARLVTLIGGSHNRRKAYVVEGRDYVQIDKILTPQEHAALWDGGKRLGKCPIEVYEGEATASFFHYSHTILEF